MGAPLTQHTAREILDNLCQLRLDGHNIEKLLRKTVKRNWKYPYGAHDTKAVRRPPRQPLTPPDWRRLIAYYDSRGEKRQALICRDKLALQEQGLEHGRPS